MLEYLSTIDIDIDYYGLDGDRSIYIAISIVVKSGQAVKFMAEGQSFAAAVPEGYSPGMTFHATVTLGRRDDDDTMPARRLRLG